MKTKEPTPCRLQGVAFFGKGMSRKKPNPEEERAYEELAAAARKLLAIQRGDNADEPPKDDDRPAPAQADAESESAHA